MKLAIAGASGRMGRMLIEAALAEPGAAVAAALDRADSPDIGRDCGEFLGRSTGARVTGDLGAIAGCDVLIDFTRPEATLAHLDACVAAGANIVIGTTGFDDAGKAAIRRASEKIAVLFSPNMSVGVNATFKLLEMAAKMLNPGYDIEIIEAHHRHKVDAPSGTALKMGETIAGALGEKLADIAV
jgi:4-hydroxy-tetrahydrodipicolinate reductase